MIYTNLTKKAMKLSFDKHLGQVDKSGLPYIYHPIHIAEQLDDEESIVVALLHDILEDTSITKKDLSVLGFSESIINLIDILTRKKNEDYFDYIKRIKNNSRATKIKLLDLAHNIDLSRLNEINDSDLLRVEKYKKAIKILKEAKNE